MTIEISVKDDKWLRADLICNNQPNGPLNLYHAELLKNKSLIEQYTATISYVKNLFPQYKNTRVVSVIGAGAEPCGCGD